MSVAGTPTSTGRLADPRATAEKRHRLRHWLIGALVIVVIGAAANLLGWDIAGWFKKLWDTISGISAGYIVAACAMKTVQTTATGYAWYSILKYAYGSVRFREVLAAYAASVALNGILPANLGTLALLIMFTLIIASATFAGVLAGYAVEKIFFTVIGAFPYLYLFLTAGGAFDIKFGWVKAHPWATAVVLIGGAVLIYMLLRWAWPKILHWWEQAKVGGQILVHPGAYFGRVFLPSLIAWLAGLCVIGIFLAAYAIPVTFHTIMAVVGGNSLANVTSATPGGAGVNQAFNVASLKSVTSATNATAYSVSQQLVTTAWNILFAIVLMAWAFGAKRGRQLVSESYAEAKEKAAEHQTQHAAKKEAKRSAEHSNASGATTGTDIQSSGGSAAQ